MRPIPSNEIRDSRKRVCELGGAEIGGIYRFIAGRDEGPLYSGGDGS